MLGIRSNGGGDPLFGDVSAITERSPGVTIDDGKPEPKTLDSPDNPGFLAEVRDASRVAALDPVTLVDLPRWSGAGRGMRDCEAARERETERVRVPALDLLFDLLFGAVGTGIEVEEAEPARDRVFGGFGATSGSLVG